MRYTDSHRQQGAAILIALVAVIVAASVAASMIGNLGHSIDSATGRQDQAQARLLARGAADWARNILADDMKRTQVDHLREPWTVKVPPTPVDSGPLDGEISGEITDWSGLFNINNLAPDGKRNPGAHKAFTRLLNTLNVNGAEATKLADDLQAWISTTDSDGKKLNRGSPTADGVTAPRSELADINELRQLPGFNDMLLERLTQYAVAVPAPSKINVNTAPAEVLAAIVDKLSLDQARILVAERDRAWFKDKADFTARLKNYAQHAQAPDNDSIDVVSQYFLLTGRASHGRAMVRMEVLLDRKDIWPEILWQRIL